jgi:cobalt/nickel transport protein
MKNQLKGFLWIGLGVSLLLALFLSPFASSSPDGLEKVAEHHGFAEKGEGWTLWQYAPFRDYTLPWIENKKLSTAIAGAMGVFAIFLFAVGFATCLKKGKVR